MYDLGKLYMPFYVSDRRKWQSPSGLAGSATSPVRGGFLAGKARAKKGAPRSGELAARSKA